MLRCLFAILLMFASGCGQQQVKVAGGPLRPDETPEERAERLLAGHSRPCMVNLDCGTNLCDRSLSLWATEDVGLCVSLFRARERWQRLTIANSIATRIERSPGLGEAVWARLEKQREGDNDVETVEGMLLMARRIGGQRAIDFVRKLEAASEGSQRLAAGLTLGRIRCPEGMDAVGQALASSQPVLRVHAAWSAGYICTPESLSVVEELALDPHPIVRQAALLALGECKSPDAALLRKKLQEEGDANEDSEPGSKWLLGLGQ